jgi:hypothetical protein
VARGWESKSVEAQIEEGNQPPEEKVRVDNSPEARAHRLRLESLRLSRSRLLDQLERARHEAHREMLQKGLSAIEREIEELSREQTTKAEPGQTS